MFIKDFRNLRYCLQACKFLPGEELVQMEAQEAVDKLRIMVKVLGTFKAQYFDYKQLTAVETPDNPWRFQNSALFLRLDAFLERCHDMLDVQQTCLQVTIKHSLKFWERDMCCCRFCSFQVRRCMMTSIITN